MDRHPEGAVWWRGAVLYQIYPRSFLDTNGDGVGDLPGITAKLDYIAGLGVDGIWICPFYRSPMDDFGYDVADYTDVDPVFGTLEDFDRLVARAHELGLKVVTDMVLSHTSTAHAWFEESKGSRHNEKSDWYVWADPRPDGSPPSNWQSVFGGPAWTWEGRRKQFYLHNFLSTQADLNVHNEAVQDALLGSMRFWLERGVDGFRLDAINFAMHDPLLTDNPPSGRPVEEVSRTFDLQLHRHNQSHPNIPLFLERIRDLLDEYGDRFTVAEVVGDTPLAEMQTFTEGTERLHTAYNFDFLYAQDLPVERVTGSLSAWAGVRHEEGWPAWAFSNHDAPRAVSRWAKPDARGPAARTFLALLLSLRGNAFLYQGEELGLPQGRVAFEHLRDPEAIATWPHTLGRDGARTPIPWTREMPLGGFTTGQPWLPMDNAHPPLSVEKQTDDPASVLSFTRRLLRVRAAHPALRIGAQRFLETPKGVVAFLREDDGVRILCAFNLTDAPIAWSPPQGAWSLLLTERPDQAGEMPDNLLAPYGVVWAEEPVLVRS